MNWDCIDKLYSLAHVNMGRIIQWEIQPWKERRLRSKLRLIAMFPYALVVGLKNKMHGILITRQMRRERHEKYFLAIVAIAKNEGLYIAEWCAWHKLLGVDCIIVYDNDSTDDTHQALQPFIDNGFVLYNHFGGRGVQCDAYHDAILRYGSLCRYMAIIDCDEFLHPLNEGETLKEIVDSRFAHSKNIGGIAVNWAIFGSSGHTTKTPGLVTERFTHRSKPEFSPNRHIKSIVRPECVKMFPNPHAAVYHTGFYCVNMEGHLVRGPFSNVASSWHHLRLDHYYTKSHNEFLIRRERGSADCTDKTRQIETLYSYDRNEVYDTSLACQSVEIRYLLAESHGADYVAKL